MRKLIYLFMVCVTTWAFTAQAGTQSLKFSVNYAGGGEIYCDGNSVAGKTLSVAAGQQMQLNYSTRDGFVFVQWMENDSILSASGEAFSYTMPSKDVNVTLVLMYDPANPVDPKGNVQQHCLYLESEPKGVGSFNRTQKSLVDEGSIFDVYAYDNGSFVFQGWKFNGDWVTKERALSSTMRTEDLTYTAVYAYKPVSPADPDSKEPEKHVLNLYSEPVGVGLFDTETQSEVEQGKTYTVTVSSISSNFAFQGWKKDGQIVSKERALTFTVGKEDITYTAAFSYKPGSPSDPGTNPWKPATGEVVIDNFTAGNLISALIDKVSDLSAVRKLTVAGKMLPEDLAFANYLVNCTYVDLCRTYGFDEIPAKLFKAAAVDTVMIPSGITSIGDSAFAYCSELKEFRSYAEYPPSLGKGVFEGVDKNFLVRVPDASKALYKSTWSQFTILNLTEDELWTLTVRLPEESKDGRYKNMTLSLLNGKSGQTTNYVVTDQSQYDFINLLKDVTYTVSLKTSKGDVLGKLENIGMTKSEVDTAFQSEMLKKVYKPSLKVLGSESKDVTDIVTITWSDAKGNYISQGASLSGIIENTVLSYSISLPDSLAILYELPDEQSLTVSSDEATVFNLTLLEKIELKGKVINADSVPLNGAYVSIVQKVSGRYPVTDVVSTGADGVYSAKVYKDDSVALSVAATNYVSETLPDFLPSAGEDKNFRLRSVTGATLTLSLKYQKAGSEFETDYDDPNNVSFSFTNVTKGISLDSVNISLPKVVLLQKVDNGDEIAIKLSSKTKAFNDVETSVKIKESNEKQVASAVIRIKGKGGISASYDLTDNASVVGTLYDENGAFVKNATYEGNSLKFENLEDGEYTLMSMGASNLFNSVLNLSSLEGTGLVLGTDYLLNIVDVNSGEIAEIKNQSIPFLKESRLYYTGKATSFAATKANVVIGNYMTLKGQIDFKDAYKDAVSDVCLIAELPEGCTVVEKSILVNFIQSGYSVDGNRVTIPLNEWSDAVLFCITPSKSGECVPNAFVQFVYEGKQMTQPIGSAPFTVKDVTINVPSSVSKKDFYVTGTAAARSTVRVYDGEILLGETSASASGNWSAKVQLQNLNPSYVHQIYAVVTPRQGVPSQSETKSMSYNPSSNRVMCVHMYHNNPEMRKNYDVKFDYENPSKAPGYYTYYIYNRQFTFTIEYSDKEGEMSGVVLCVTTSKGDKSYLEAEPYDEGRWYAVGNFGSMYDGNLPVNVSVFDDINGEQVSPTRDANYGIDPSGFVYEAIKSNRVADVTATIYYQEPIKNEYGDVTGYKEMLWDAEEYQQENPLFTDENGLYRWDVPEGNWRVKFEKDGYQTTYSEWLPIPPPQLEVNIAINRTTPPYIETVRAYESGSELKIEIIFDKYMDVSSLMNDTVVLITQKVAQKDSVITGAISAIDGDGVYATKFIVETEGLVANEPAVLNVSKTVKSYCGIQMERNETKEFTGIKAVESLTVDSICNILYGQSVQLKVKVGPESASAGLTLKATSSSPNVARVTSEATIDASGEALLTIEGQLPGKSSIYLSIDNTDVEATVDVHVTKEVKIASAPVSTKADGSALYHNSNIVLSTSTDDAVIRYTTDGTIPTAESEQYTEPIVIENDNMVVKAVAMAEGWENSDTVTYSYTIRKSTDIDLEKGWNWVSVNTEGSVTPQSMLDNCVERFVSQDKELIYDKNFKMMVGNLTEVLPQELYKVKSSSDKKIGMNKFYELNAVETAIDLNAGFNWIGYPVSFSQTVSEALKYATPSEGDYILSHDEDGGYVRFENGKWNSELKMLPGHGYIYYAEEDMSFKYNTVQTEQKSVAPFTVSNESLPWHFDSHAYPDVMCIVADLSVEGMTAIEGSYNVAAFCQGECRGIAKWADGNLILSVYGNAGDDISFRALAKGSESEIPLEEHFTLEELLKGTIFEPMHLTASVVDALTPASSLSWGVYTNRFDNTITVHGLGTMQSVSLCDMAGKVFKQLQNVPEGASIDVQDIPAGVYVITTVANGQTHHTKITKF